MSHSALYYTAPSWPKLTDSNLRQAGASRQSTPWCRSVVDMRIRRLRFERFVGLRGACLSRVV